MSADHTRQESLYPLGQTIRGHYVRNDSRPTTVGLVATRKPILVTMTSLRVRVVNDLGVVRT